MNEKEIRNLIQAAHIYPNVHVTLRNLERVAETGIRLIKANEDLKMQIREIKFSPGMKVCVIKKIIQMIPPFGTGIQRVETTGHKIYTGIIKFTEFDPKTNEFLMTLDGIAGKWKEDEIYFNFHGAKNALDKKLDKENDG